MIFFLDYVKNIKKNIAKRSKMSLKKLGTTQRLEYCELIIIV